MKKTITYLFLIFIVASCCKDHSDIIPGQDFISDEILQKIIDNGHPINEGFNPPELTGKYFISPLVLVSSNFDDPYLPVHIFDNGEVEFKNFNSDDLKLDVIFDQGGSISLGEGSFISGTGEDFTIYVKVETTDIQNHTTINTILFSGTLKEDGIENLFLSFFMIDDKGDPNESYIENGQGRLAKDDDGFSPEI